MKTLLAVESLVIEYAAAGYAVKPIDGLDLEIPGGHLALLLGPSGCGKTTLLSALAGLLTPTSGRIVVDGLELTGMRGRELARFRQEKVGVVFQSFNLLPGLTAAENVAMPMWTAGRGRRAGLARAAELLAAVDMADRASHRPGQLSGGQQQRVAIARALALDPPVILADEPTAHLDHVQVEGVLRILRSLAAPGRAVVVATHDDRLTPVADQLVSLAPHTQAAGGPSVTIELPADAVLFREGDPSDRIWVVDQGQIALTRQRPDGSPVELSVVGPGDHFGEMGPLFDLRRSATAVARTDVVLTGHTVRAFREVVGVEGLAQLLGRER
ncbi:MAG TPA: ATP-binding cassette domain-containing protein [Acidimicrobiales bacterium]|nr:ATP-binding cassette domain-containing protein [Acidimicrobiales bacterium]